MNEAKTFSEVSYRRINYYMAFAEYARVLTNSSGRVGLILDSGIATAESSKFFFQEINDKGELSYLFDFENKGFFKIHRSIKFCLLGLSKKGNEQAILKFFLTDVQQLKEKNDQVILRKEDFKLLNPNTKTCPVFRTVLDKDLTIKIYKSCPILLDRTQNSNPWNIDLKQGLFNMTSDKKNFLEKEILENQGFYLDEFGNFLKEENDLKVKYFRLYEAKMIHQFDHRFGTFEGQSLEEIKNGICRELKNYEKTPERIVIPRYWIAEDKYLQKLISKKFRNCFKFFFGFRRIARSTDERTTIASILPISGAGDTIVIAQISALKSCLLLACWNSFVLDYVARQKIGGSHLDQWQAEQLPVLPPDRFTEELILLIVPRVLELTYTARDIKPFADDLWKGANESLREAILRQWKENNSPSPSEGEGKGGGLNSPFKGEVGKESLPIPPFRWDEERRAQIRAELDAIFAHLYGLTRDEFAYILDTFPIVRRKDEERFGEYRTKRLCLEQYDRFDGQIPHPKPLDQKPTIRVISLKEAQERKREKATVTYEEIQEKLSPEYSLPKAAEPKPEYLFSEDLERIKEKIFDLLVESNRALSAKEIANELKIAELLCKKALEILIREKLIKKVFNKFVALD